jgi:WD40 repeat protein
MIVTAGADEVPVKLWDGSSGRELRQFRLPGHVKGIAYCAFSPDLRSLAAGSGDKSVIIWRIADGELLFRGKTHGNTVWRCTFSPDGSRLASGDYDGTIKVWDWRLGEELSSIPAHTARVDDLIFSPDAALLFSRCRYEGALKLWDAKTGEWRGEYRSGSRIEAAAIDRRWQRLAVGSAGSEFDLLEVINLELGPAIATAWKDASGSLGFACPGCARWYQLQESSLGSEITCPGCESGIRLNDFVVIAEWRPVAQATAY